MDKSLCHAARPCRLPCESALSVLPSSRTAHVPLPAYPPCGPHRFFGEPRPRLACGYAAVLCNGITELNSRRGALQFKFGWPPDRAGNRENQLVGSAFLRGSQCTANRVLWCTLVPCQAVSYIPLCRLVTNMTKTLKTGPGIACSCGPMLCKVITELKSLRGVPSVCHAKTALAPFQILATKSLHGLPGAFLTACSTLKSRASSDKCVICLGGLGHVEWRPVIPLVGPGPSLARRSSPRSSLRSSLVARSFARSGLWPDSRYNWPPFSMSRPPRQITST